MKEAILVFLFVSIVAVAGFLTLHDDEYEFPTGDLLRRCMDHTECGAYQFCDNVNGGDGSYDSRRGHQCRPKFNYGTSCYADVHCRTNYCDKKQGFCSVPTSP